MKRVPIRITPLPWDSEHFGVSIGRLDLSGDWPGERALREAAQSSDLQCLYLETQPDHAYAAARVFDLAGLRLLMTLDTLPQVAQRERMIRPAVEADMSDLRGIARVSHQDTRFFNDTRFDRARTSALYEKWIERDWKAENGFVLTVGGKGAPQGYISGSINEKGRGNIGLLAVAPGARRLGLGNKLLRGALLEFAAREADGVDVVVQGEATGAQRAYQRVGFRPSDLTFWFHFWNE